MTDYVKDAQGNILAVRHQDGSKEWFIDPKNGQALGYYYIASNKTLDAQGRLVGEGNQLMRLLR